MTKIKIPNGSTHLEFTTEDVEPPPVDPPTEPPVEPPEPPVEPEPPVTPPEPVTAGIISKIPFGDKTRVVAPVEWGKHNRYERFRRFSTLKPTVVIACTNYASGGGVVRLEGKYRLVMDNAIYGSWVEAKGTKTLSLPVPVLDAYLPDLPEDVQIQIESDNPADICIPFWYRVGAGEPASLSLALYSKASVAKTTDYMDALVPARYCPQSFPLVKREPGPLTLSRNSLYWSQLTLPGGDHLPRRVNGHLTASNSQRYHYSDFIKKYPPFQMIDGPRGFAIQQNPTHIMVDVHGNPYCSSPWSIWRVDREGNVRTRAGWRTNPETFDLELVGDWSRIPESRHGFRDIWGFWWDERTTATDPTVDTKGLTVSPHASDVVMFVADSGNDRICKLTFQHRDHAAEPIVEEFITGLKDPWDITGKDGIMYVTERGAHRVSKWDCDTGKYLGDLVASPGPWIDEDHLYEQRLVRAKVSRATARKHDCIAPSGLYMLGDYIYWGCHWARQIKRIHKDGGPIELAFTKLHYSTIVTQGMYYKFCLMDDGTLLLCTWDNRWQGLPHVHRPDGSRVDLMSYSASRVPVGASSSSVSHHAYGLYSTAVGVGNNSIFFGNNHGALFFLSREQPGDTMVDTKKYYRGRNSWRKSGKEMLYGPAGQNPYGLEMPELSEDEAYYLECVRL